MSLAPAPSPLPAPLELNSRGRGPILTDRDQRRGDRTHGPRGEPHGHRARLARSETGARTGVRRDRERRRPRHRDGQGPEALPPVLTSVNTRSGLPRSTPDRTHTATARTPAPPAQPRRTPHPPAPRAAPSPPPLSPPPARRPRAPLPLSPEPVHTGAQWPTRPYNGFVALFPSTANDAPSPKQPPSRKTGGAHSEERSGQLGTLLKGLTAAVNGASIARPYPSDTVPLTMPPFRSGSSTLPRA